MKRPPKNGVSITRMKTLLVDGNALFKTAYHGAKNEYNRKGEHIGGLYQFFTILRRLLENHTFHNVYVFWDGSFSGKLRYEIYNDYKSGRDKDYINGSSPIEEDFRLQWIRVTEYLNELFIRQIYHEIVESDDFIAYYCLHRQKNEKIIICSSDRDFCQLIDDDVTLYLIDKKEYVTKENYRKYFNHHPENSCLIKLISGDSSDSIKGIKGVSEATLLKYIPELSEKPLTLTNVIEKAQSIQDERAEVKKKPLKTLNNIIHGVTDGIQGDKVYIVNDLLVNLKKPLLTGDAIDEIEAMMGAPLDPSERDGTKKVMEWMREDGFDEKLSYGDGIPGYLIPYKKLIKREEQIYTNFLKTQQNEEARGTEV